MVSSVEAGEDPDVVYAEQPPTFSLSKARAKIFAPGMTIQKLSELMGGDDKWRIVNWKYVARMNGTYTPPPTFYFQLPLLRSFLPPPIPHLPSVSSTDTIAYRKQAKHAPSNSANTKAHSAPSPPNTGPPSSSVSSAWPNTTVENTVLAPTMTVPGTRIRKRVKNQACGI